MASGTEIRTEAQRHRSSSDVGPSGYYAHFSDPGENAVDIEAPKKGNNRDSSSSRSSTSNVEKKTSNNEKSFRQHLDIFWAMSLPYFRQSGEARCLFALLILLTLGWRIWRGASTSPQVSCPPVNPHSVDSVSSVHSAVVRAPN